MAERKVRQLDKTILLAFLVFTKGSPLEKYIEEKKITSGFATTKRKMVRHAMNRLVDMGLLSKDPEKRMYKFTKKGLDEAKKVLLEGAKLWHME